MNPVIQEVILKNIITYVIPAFLSLLGVLIIYVLNAIKDKIKSENSITALDAFSDIVNKIVLGLNQKIVWDIKKIQKRKLNKNDVINLKKEAKEEIEKCITKKIKQDIKFYIKDYNSYIENSIESKVKELKMKSEKNNE